MRAVGERDGRVAATVRKIELLALAVGAERRRLHGEDAEQVVAAQQGPNQMLRVTSVPGDARGGARAFLGLDRTARCACARARAA
jgi:hypothetical protein